MVEIFIIVIKKKKINFRHGLSFHNGPGGIRKEPWGRVKKGGKMKDKKGKETKLVVIGVMALALLIPVKGIDRGNEVDFREIAMNYISEKYDIPKEDLMILGETNATYRLIDENIWCAKILDKENHKIYGISIDESGKIVNESKYQEKELNSKYGKLEPTLYEKLQMMEDKDRVEVVIWLREPDITQPQPPPIETGKTVSPQKISEYERAYKEYVKERKEAYRKLQRPIIDILKEKGVEEIFCSEYAPLIVANLSKETILFVEKLPDVASIDYGGWKGGVEMYSSARTLKADDIGFNNPYLKKKYEN